MFTRKLLVLSVLGSCTLLLLAGCPSFDERTNNQGGSNQVQAATKLLSNQLGSLNPDDVQVLADIATQASGATNVPQVTDEQAAAVVSFLAANNIQTIEDVQRLIDNPQGVVVPPDVQSVLETIADPSAYQSIIQGLGT